MTRRLLTLTLALVLAAAASVSAQDADPELESSRLHLETERVVVFKDGYCLVVRKATATSDADGVVFTEEVPDAAVLGSFWATPDTGRLLSMTAGVEGVEETSTEDVACATYLELLAANVEKQAQVELEDGETVVGVIGGVLATPAEQPVHAGSGGYRNPWEPVPPAVSTVSVMNGSLFSLTTNAGDVVLPVSRVRGLTIREMQTTHARETTTRSSRKRLRFRFEGGAAERSLRIMYFRPGVRWIPTYRIGLAEGEDRSKARVQLQAELLNEAEDLDDVAFDLVVGVPNFRYKETVSPFVLEQALRNALAQAAPHLMGQQMLGGGGNAFSNRAGEWRGPSTPPSGAGGGALGLATDIAADRSQDLFVYSLPRMTLARGERAAVPVFESEVDYRDVYTWDLQLTRADVEVAPGGKGVSPLTLSNNRIWHQIELVNATDVPWTTGAALMLDGVQPLAQELLTYTPAGGRVRVPVTVAIDLRGDVAEEEIGRDMNAMEWMRNRYARIDKKARATLTSYRQEPSIVEIVCRLGGHADSASHDGNIVVSTFEKADWSNYLGHPAVNNHSTVTFALTLPPGEAVEPEIVFHYFARH